MQTTWWSFAVGDMVAILVFIIEMSVKPEQAREFESRMPSAPSYIYFGGLFGAVFIASTIIVTGIIGSAPFFVCIVCGQIIGSVVIEELGAMGSETRSPGIMRILGRRSERAQIYNRDAIIFQIPTSSQSSMHSSSTNFLVSLIRRHCLCLVVIGVTSIG